MISGFIGSSATSGEEKAQTYAKWIYQQLRG
jgi:hypothetical protein